MPYSMGDLHRTVAVQCSVARKLWNYSIRLVRQSVCVSRRRTTPEVSGSWIKILTWDVHLGMLLPEEGGRGGRKIYHILSIFLNTMGKNWLTFNFKIWFWLYSLTEYSQNILKSSIAKIAASKVPRLPRCSHPILPNVSCWLARPIGFVTKNETYPPVGMFCKPCFIWWKYLQKLTSRLAR